MDQPGIVNRLARMGYPDGASDASEHPDAALVKRLVADNPDALELVRAMTGRSGPPGNDARRLLLR